MTLSHTTMATGPEWFVRQATEAGLPGPNQAPTSSACAVRTVSGAVGGAVWEEITGIWRGKLSVSAGEPEWDT